MTWTPLALFALLFIPLANWQRWILPGIPNYHLQHLLFYACVPALLYAWRRRAWTPVGAWGRARPLLPWVGVVLLAQTWAFWASATHFAVDGQGVWLAVLVSLAKLCMQLPFVFFFMEICHILVQQGASRRNLTLGAVASFAALMVLCAMQGAYVYAVTLHLGDPANLEAYKSVLRFMAAIFESRWIGGVYDFYASGTYALTILRINGFFEEASGLAAVLGVFYVPLGFGLLGLGRQRGNRRIEWAGMAMVLAACIFMVLARTSTGLVLALVGLVLLGAVLVAKVGGRDSGRRWLAGVVAVVVVMAALTTIAVKVPSIYLFAAERLDYSKASRLPRVVVAKEVLHLAVVHPLTGVGRGWVSPHVFESAEFQKAVGGDAEMLAWRQQGKLVILSLLPEALAEYGIPLVLAGVAMLGFLWRRLRRLQQLYPQAPEFAFASAACGAWCIMFLAASPGSHDIRNPLIALPFFLFVAMARNPLRKEGADR